MQKVNDLLDLPNLGSEKPFVLMDNILSLCSDTTTKNTSKLLLGLFLRRLPLQMRSQLANYPANSPAELAAAVDAKARGRPYYPWRHQTWDFQAISSSVFLATVL